MILCFQREDLSKILLVAKFEMNWPNIKLICVTFCAIWHYRALQPNQVKRTSQDYINEFIICILNLLVISKMQ